MFKSTPDANLGVTGIGGRTQVRSNNDEGASALDALANELEDSLARVADALSTDVGAFSVSFGQREDYFRVGGDANFDAGAKHPTGALYDGTDAQKALEIAVRDAILDGAIKGLNAAEERLLRQGDDIEKAIKDVLDFRGVSQALRQLKDPVGAALDALDNEFTRLDDIFDRAGASVEQYAELEELYGIQRMQKPSSSREI